MLGVIGLGAIGGRIANYAQRLGMNVLGYDPYVSIETAWNISHHVKRVADVKEIFANSDYITVHVPLTDETRHTFDSEAFLNKDKITVFPHVGGSTAEAELNCAIMAGKTIRQFMETGEITNSVNFPNVHQALTAPYRITLINKNVPNIVAKISTAVSDLGINIDNIINRSKGDYAYTLLDLDETDKAKIDHLVANFEASDNIVRVRLITKK